MKKRILAFLLLSAMMSGAALAQDDSTGIRESTDQAKADSVLRHAEEIRMKQNQTMSSDRQDMKTSKKKGKSAAKKKSKSVSSKTSSNGMSQDSMDE